MENGKETSAEPKSLNFIEQIITDDLASEKYKAIQIRFPPKPNGFYTLGILKGFVWTLEWQKISKEVVI